MKTTILFLLMAALLLMGCADNQPNPSATPARKEPSKQPALDPNPTSTPVQAEPGAVPSATPDSSIVASETPEPPSESTASPYPTMPITVAAGNGLDHDPVFIIQNTGRFSGEGGQAPWLSWGADSLAVGPDGSFWIADTPADPDRLLHYSPQGELLLELPMRFGERSYWARDVAVDSTGVWVLDYLSQPSVVLQLSPEGNLLASFDIPSEFTSIDPNGMTIPGLWRIPFAENGRVTLDGPYGIVELTVTNGSPSFKKATSYMLWGTTYADVQDGLMASSTRVGMQSLQPDHFLNRAWLLGANWDGSFYVREDEGNNDQGKSEPTDQFVRRYNGDGALLGIALLPLPELHQPSDIALGPDGNVYALRSRSDHSVEILRLRFSSDPAPLLSPYTALPPLNFQPLLPSGDPPATDLDAARQVMLTFFSELADGHYEEAAALYGGSYDAAITQDPGISLDQPAQAWMSICMSEFCLPVSDILDSRPTAEGGYEFLVGFAGQNGYRFDYSICCGYFGPTPSVSFFVYSVKVNQVDGQWKVMGGPVPLP